MVVARGSGEWGVGTRDWFNEYKASVLPGKKNSGDWFYNNKYKYVYM